MKKIFLIILLISSTLVFAKKTKKIEVDTKNYDLTLTQEDILVLPEDSSHFVKDGNGVHLFVKKRGDIQSAMLMIESSNYVDPEHYIMRSQNYNPVNSNEIRYFYGKFSKTIVDRTIDSLISSTVMHNQMLGDCFHFYIPKKMYYGYVVAYQYECFFEEGMTINIRTFNKKYCDINDKFFDNHLQLNVSSWQKEESFSEIAEAGDGKLIKITNASELPQKLEEEIAELNNEEKIDLVFVIDATDSMKDDFVELRKNWLPLFEKQMKDFKDIRLGLLFYKDYGDDFKTNGMPVKIVDFTKSVSSFSKNVKKVTVSGGGDIPEAVYEALYYAVKNFKWNKDAKKKLILIGDAEPHENDEKYNITFETISQVIKENDISTDCFLISDTLGKVSSSKDMKSIEKEKITEELSDSVNSIDAK